MKTYILLVLATVFLTSSTSAQPKSNDAISRQIKALKIEKTFTLSYDQNSNVTKLMAVTENFSDLDAGNTGIQAMNFAIGFMYSGKELAKAPDNVLLTFWVLAKKPRFAVSNNLLLLATNFDLGSARYAAKPRQNMEYLNFEISRENLKKIAGERDARIQLGEAGLTFTSSQLKAISDIITLSDPRL